MLITVSKGGKMSLRGERIARKFGEGGWGGGGGGRNKV